MFPRLCSEPGCKATTIGGPYCEDHRRRRQQAYDQQAWRKHDQKFYQSAAWKRLVAWWLSQPGGCCCDECGTFGDLEVHHRVPRKDAPERALDPTNLATKCGKHHRMTHNRMAAGRRGSATKTE